MTDIGPGDIVVCIDAGGTDSRVACLVEGARYVIRIVGAGTNWHTGRPAMVCLLVGLSTNNYEGYLLSRFRPLRKSDSEIFREMVKLPEVV